MEKIGNRKAPLPRGVRIEHHPGRSQPYTVWIPGSVKYSVINDLKVWKFCRTEEEVERYVAKNCR